LVSSLWIGPGLYSRSLFSYACGRLWPGCHCDQAAEVDNRNATILGEDRDLALAYVLAGMDRAAR
jgi:hypothetical protein